jgi:hypothetical protein
MDGVANEADIDGTPCHPGQTINCRCLPLPLVEGLDYEEEPDEESGAEAPAAETEEVEPDEEPDVEERDAADAADRPGLRIGDQMHLGLAREKMHAPVMEWIHRPGEGKAALFAAHESLLPRERAQWDADIQHAFREAHGGHDSAVMYRMKDNPSHMGGMSLTTERPTHLRPDQYHAFEVRPEHVLAHWNQNESPLGGKAFGHEREVILKPNAEPRALGDGSWDESKHPRGPDGKFDADWDEGKHPRDERGRFGEGSAGIGEGHGATGRAGQNFGRTLRRGHNEPRIEPPINPKRPAGATEPQKSLDELHFSSTFVESGAALNFEQVVGQFEHPQLAAWLDKQPMNERPRLELLKDADQVPTESGGRIQGLYFSQRYDPMTDSSSVPRIQVGVGAGYPNVPPKDLRDWGDVWGVAEHQESIKNERGFASGQFEQKTPTQYAHEVFLHELGHHIEMGPVAARYHQTGDHPPIRKIVDDAYEKLGLNAVADMTPYEKDLGHRVEIERVRERVLRGAQPSPAISRYAAMNPREYFAESFGAYIVHPAALEKHDPVGYGMVKTVLKRLGVE